MSDFDCDRCGKEVENGNMYHHRRTGVALADERTCEDCYDLAVGTLPVAPATLEKCLKLALGYVQAQEGCDDEYAEEYGERIRATLGVDKDWATRGEG
jgi:hypothetical protein